MTKGSFRYNNHGICNGGDLLDEMLNMIFDQIQKEPICLKEDDEACERIEGTGENTPGLYSAVFPSLHFYEIEKGREYGTDMLHLWAASVDCESARVRVECSMLLYLICALRMGLT